MREQEFPQIPVRIPRALAERAVAAWQRDDEEDGPQGPETPEDRIARHRAGAIALIGLAIDERGRQEGDDIVVDLHPEQIGLALDAADDRGDENDHLPHQTS